jgi:glutamate dehydrogenase
MTAHADPLLERVQSHLVSELAETVRWFHATMPSYYFGVTAQVEQERHVELLHAARRAAARGADAPMTLVDDHEAGKVLVVGRPAKHRLLDVVDLIGGARTLAERAIHRVELHTAKDGSLFLYAFVYGPGAIPPGFDLAAHKQAIMTAVCGKDDRCSQVSRRFLDAVDQGYLARSYVDRVVRHIQAWSQLHSAEDIQVSIERGADDSGAARLTLACGAATPWAVLAHAARVIERHGLHITRGYLDWVPAVEGEGRAIIASLYAAVPAKNADRSVVAAAADLGAVRRSVGGELLHLYLDGTYTLDELEQLRALLGCAGQLVAADHPYLDVDEAGVEAMRQHPDLCRDLCALLAARFQPGQTIHQAQWEKRHRDLATRCHGVEPRSQAAVLDGMLHVLTHVRLTNAWRPGRLGISFKLDPAVLPPARFPQKPFGLLFFSGPSGRGFHVRFRPSARGGLRLLTPRNPGQWSKARDGLLKEVYDLAWAQQLKNKDIPEGGAKCICLVEAGADPTEAVKQVVDSLIDLILPADKVPEVIGPHGTGHDAALIFLGPDENMTPERIIWVAQRAKARGLPHHATLMSSKPGAGINHKEYGVTSEGIFTWITAVLPIVGIVGDAPYTVKMTGGPDGDVGGNLLRILSREHRKRCQVVAIGDGTGCAEDPRGLDWDELLRLVKESKGIAAFNTAKLSGHGSRVCPATDKAGEEARNTLHNRIAADLFVPCGGRPYTINDENWKAFLAPGGKPSARAMVEGANIFLTTAARQGLEDAGLVVIKDSSANKGGVICSSYEVLAGLVITDEEFLAMKPQYVADVIELIRSAAQSEAKALIAAWKRRSKTERLSDLSAQVSEEINRVSGLLEPVITAHLDDEAMRETWRGHLESHSPHCLVVPGPDGKGFRDRLHARIPRPHKVAILAKRLASRMVYKEGLTWCRTYIHEDRLWDTLSTYLSAEMQVQAVCFHLAGLNLPGGEELVRVIAAGAQRELVRRRLGQEF